MAEISSNKNDSEISALRWVAYIFLVIFMTVFTAAVLLSTIYLRSFVMEIPSIFFLIITGIFAITLGWASAAIFYALTRSHIALVAGITIVSMFSTAVISGTVVVLNKLTNMFARAGAEISSGIPFMPSLINPYPNFILVAFILIACLNLPAMIMIFTKTEKLYHYAAAFMIIFLFTFFLSVIGVFILANSVIMMGF